MIRRAVDGVVPLPGVAVGWRSWHTACSTYDAMWLTLDTTSDGRLVEHVLPHLQAIAQFTEDLRTRIGPLDEGADGVDGILALYRRLKAVLDALPEAELERIVGSLDQVEATLRALRDDLAQLTRLKRTLA